MIRWSGVFLLKALRRYGFYEKFVYWIYAILLYARLSIKINGSAHGFFGCEIEVRLRYPLSPLLFCLAEDIHSKGIFKLVLKGKMHIISSPRGVTTTSYIFYVDAFIIFLDLT